MANAKFILKEPNSKEDTLVYLFFNYQYKRFKYSTGEKILPKFWNPSKQRAKETRKFREYPEFNARLNLFENAINTVFRRLLNDGVQPNNPLLKENLEAELSGKVLQNKKITLFKFIQEYIEESKGNKKLGTIKVYNTTFNYLEKYAKATQKDIDFDTINLSFYNRYIKYLTVDNNLSDNTAGKHIKTIKTFMNEATDRGLNENLDFKKRKFKTIREESDSIYLTNAELEKFEKLDLSSSPKLEKTRDLFLIGCYTGLRFSDFTQIKPENILDNNSKIQIRTQKTGERVTIPLHKTVRKILAKYDNQLPKAYSNQVMNRYLKDVASLAGLKHTVQRTIKRAGKIEKEPVKKFNLVTTHTARRSFATNLFLADIPAISIMKITGHKSERSFLKYIRVTQEQNADKLLNHPYFN
ncbi:site-specific integrase [Christiangramia sp.]|uniref:site-specific integrase n=1 Tax=Christiangramia sp. TaxID=1931228 RepID=UPI002624E85F|nr:site-specific integrase [Christiangramia sp.]